MEETVLYFVEKQGRMNKKIMEKHGMAVYYGSEFKVFSTCK